MEFTCQRSGFCCINATIPVTAPDIWKIMHDEKLSEVFQDTTSLFSGKEPFLWTVKAGGMPGCFAVKRLRPTSLTIGIKNFVCPFLVPEIEEYSLQQLIEKRETMDLREILSMGSMTRGINLPRLSCLLGDSKPTECEAYPLGRRNDAFYLPKRSCPTCTPKTPETAENGTVREFIQAHNLEQSYRLNNITSKLLDEVYDLANHPNYLGARRRDLGHIIGRALFNYDSVYQDDFEDILNTYQIEKDSTFPRLRKPETFLEHLENIRKFSKVVAKQIPFEVRTLEIGHSFEEL